MLNTSFSSQFLSSDYSLCTKAEQRLHLRRFFRQKRASLSLQQKAQAEQQIADIVLKFLQPRRVRNIAIYRAFDGEISTRLLIKRLWQQGYHLYLPVLHPFSHGNLLFLEYTIETPMKRNKFSIEEPKLDVTKVLPSHRLDIIFTPLVAFDSNNNRLGMGCGFYDRTLENWHKKNFLPVGLAYRCQQVKEIPCEKWDIPLFEILAV